MAGHPTAAHLHLAELEEPEAALLALAVRQEEVCTARAAVGAGVHKLVEVRAASHQLGPTEEAAAQVLAALVQEQTVEPAEGAPAVSMEVG